jgi:hypothetical protein
MDRLLTWCRDNPQFAVLAAAAAILALVMAILAITMLRAGASLRPIIWFLGFFGIVAGPQAVVHLLDGFVLRRAGATSVVPSGGTVEGRTPGLAPVPWATVFGPKADPALITDAKRGLSAILDAATEARLSFNVDGESALAARFASSAAATGALNRYGNFFAFANAHGSDASGWTARRHAGQGEWVHVVAAGPELYAWTGATKESVLANRVRTLGPMAEGKATGSPVESGTRAPELVSKRLARQTGVMLAIVSLNIIGAGVWFFKGSAWAARVDGSRALRPVSTDMLRGSLVVVNQRDVPTEVTPRPDGTLEIDWRYGDARWFDLMRVHRMKRAHRLVLIFDESSHTVRVREYWSAFDASAGVQGLNLHWTMATGIQFFAFEHTRVFGAQLGPDGKPTGELSKAYTFNLQALKQPIIDAVTAAGWRWQPVAWNAPASLRWLTE